jgi:GR25 family glycosyltransferase involved in LPS biosynthesis
MEDKQMQCCPINKLVDAVFLINLDRRPDRLSHSTKQIKKVSITNVLRFTGIDGNEIDYHGNMNKGAVGCMLSHLGIIKYAKQKGFKSIFILEDDVVFADGFNDILAKALNELPNDWCLLYTGSYNVKPVTRLTTHISKVNGSLALHAYAIHSRFYDVIINSIEQSFDKQIDIYYFLLQQKHPCYCVNPKIAFQLEGYSDIQNQNVKYTVLNN